MPSKVLPLALSPDACTRVVLLNFASKIKTFNFVVLIRAENVVTDYDRTARRIMAGAMRSVNDYFDSAVECEPYSF